jgi:hypothetical protein
MIDNLKKEKRRNEQSQPGSARLLALATEYPSRCSVQRVWSGVSGVSRCFPLLLVVSSLLLFVVSLILRVVSPLLLLVVSVLLLLRASHLLLPLLLFLISPLLRVVSPRRCRFPLLFTDSPPPLLRRTSSSSNLLLVEPPAPPRPLCS